MITRTAARPLLTCRSTSVSLGSESMGKGQAGRPWRRRDTQNRGALISPRALRNSSSAHLGRASRVDFVAFHANIRLWPWSKEAWRRSCLTVLARSFWLVRESGFRSSRPRRPSTRSPSQRSGIAQRSKPRRSGRRGPLAFQLAISSSGAHASRAERPASVHLQATPPWLGAIRASRTALR